MVTLKYVFDDEEFEYEVDRFDIEKKLFDWLYENWTTEDCIEYILNLDGSTVDLLEDFSELIHELFEDDAEEFYNECKNSDNGVDQGDFV